MYFGPNCQLVSARGGHHRTHPRQGSARRNPARSTPNAGLEARALVAFRAGRDPNASIALMDMQSGEVRRIAPQLSGMTPPGRRWQPSGLCVQGPAPDYNVDIYITTVTARTLT